MFTKKEDPPCSWYCYTSQEQTTLCLTWNNGNPLSHPEQGQPSVSPWTRATLYLTLNKGSPLSCLTLNKGNPLSHPEQWQPTVSSALPWVRSVLHREQRKCSWCQWRLTALMAGCRKGYKQLTLLYTASHGKNLFLWNIEAITSLIFHI